ncbi:MAG: hypothetical protein EBR82_11250 [Caulobacteraceae bacterium]|nr:hypothetical protein [Caulobacteraceae bacterium]
MTYLRREIDLKFQLGEGDFGAAGVDTVEVTGLRVACNIQKNGDASYSRASLKVYGLTLSTMNKLSTLGKPLVDGRNNTVTVTAGDANGKAVVFSGTITEAWVDGANAPEVSLSVEAYVGLIDALKPLPASSFKGSVDAATIVASIAQQTGRNFENGGVEGVTLTNPNYPGTGRQQLESVARDGGFNLFIDDVTNAVAIWPRDGVRGGQIPLINAQTGLVGFPTHTENGILITSLFNPAIVFGRAVRVESILTPAAGTWSVFAVSHDLESLAPGGAWFTRAQCNVFGMVAIARQ